MSKHQERLVVQARAAVGKARGSSSLTQDKREGALRAIAEHAAKCGCQRIQDLKTKHMTSFFSDLRERGLSPSTIAGYATTAREIASAIGKDNIVPRDNEALGGRRDAADRYNPQEIDVDRWLEVRAEMYAKAEWLGLASDMRAAFGVRAKESILTSRVTDEAGRVVLDVDGAKGGRPRQVAIETPEQRAVVKAVADYLQRTGQRSLIPEALTLKQAMTMQRNAWARAGGTKENKANMHCTRAQYAACLQREGHSRREIAISLGHGRDSVVRHYVR